MPDSRPLSCPAPQTFLSWVRYSGWAKKLRDTWANAGAKHWNATKNPDKAAAYKEARALALSGRVSVMAAARQFAERGVS